MLNLLMRLLPSSVIKRQRAVMMKQLQIVLEQVGRLICTAAYCCAFEMSPLPGPLLPLCQCPLCQC